MLKIKVVYLDKYSNYKSGTPTERDMSKFSFDIEKQSFDIIESEIGEHHYTENEWIVVRRIIHATADFDFAKKCKIIFYKNAIESGFKAFTSKSYIVTDVEMISHGINKNSLSRLGMSSVCYINDPDCIENSKKYKKTRSAFAMQKAMDKIHNGIVVIGNAPTALYEVIDLIKTKNINPFLVIGVPVGFVSAVESKDELSKLNVPYITNVGRKGGSSAATSIINALMLLYFHNMKNQ